MFVTVGSQGPFDRLIRTIDRWAGLQRDINIFAQIGRSAYRPRNFPTIPFMSPFEFRSQVEAAAVVVGHAGIGSIITALEFGKRMVVLPRRDDLGETRSDHQLATANRLAQDGRITVAFTEEELMITLDRLDLVRSVHAIDRQASPRLIRTIRAFLEATPSLIDPLAAPVGGAMASRRQND